MQTVILAETTDSHSKQCDYYTFVGNNLHQSIVVSGTAFVRMNLRFFYCKIGLFFARLSVILSAVI